LVGRARERDVLDRLLDGVRGGRGLVLVVHGEAGIGKTALLEYAVEASRGFRIARTSGVEAEMELPFAAVQQLCSPFLDFLDRLPQPQHEALGVAFGLSTAPAPSPFLVGLAILGLLAEAAEEGPLLAVVDDAHWLDHASVRALAFVARRLLAEKLALVFAARHVDDALGGLPSLHVEPLRRRDARALLESVMPARLDEPVLERIVAETRGNPLALLELPRGLTPTQLAGGFGLPAAAPLSASIEESFTRRLDELPDDMRLLLLLAAAEPVGDPLLLWRSAEKLGISPLAVTASETDGLLELGEQVTFRHPLVRSAVYGSAPAEQRRAVHLALAEATDRAADPDRRAWHLAAAASAPDEEVARELERSAGRAQARGGLAAGAAFLQRSVALTGDPARRADRALAAARANLYAGSFDEALRLIALAEGDSPDELQQAEAELLRAQVAFVSSPGSDAPRLLLQAAQRMEPLDVHVARETYLDALSAAMFAGRLARPGGSALEISQAARAAAPPLHAPRAPDFLLDGLATLYSEGYAFAVPMLGRALNSFGRNMSAAQELRWLWPFAVSAVHLWDDERWEALAERHVQVAREAGALGELPLALSQRLYVHLFAGDLTLAASLVEEIQAATEATGSSLAPYGAVGLAALHGREAETSALIEANRTGVTQRGEGIGISVFEWAKAVLYNGLGRYEDAYAAALESSKYPQELSSPNWGLVELIEAAVRSGAPELAADAYRRLLEMAERTRTDWGLGITARSRALLTDGDSAEAFHRDAIERLGRTRLRPDLARAHLLYGEWLRRQRRRLDARNALRIAHDMFTDFGMEAFAERARIELEATGERARKRTVDTVDQLTPQEAQVAHLAVQGNTNREIAAQLFISPSTVEYHLRKAFRKLGVKSRTQLAQRTF